MKGVTCLLLCLIHLRLSRACIGEGPLLFCQEIPPVFRPGFSLLLMVLKDVGVLNSSVLHSDALSSVSKLRIEDAGITEISAGAFRSFQNLSVLSLIQNQLTDLDPGWFSSPGVLVDLSLTGNRIRVLNESTFEQLANLRTLRLNGNRITEIHPNTFSPLTNLSELDLSDNNMTQVSPQVFRTLRSTRIHLDRNPWTCSCEAAEFVHFVKDLRSRFLLEKPSDVTCESPPSLRGQNVWNVSVCETETTSRPTTGTRPKPTEEPKTSSPKSTSGTETSDQNKPADETTTTSSHSVTPPPSPGTETSLPPGTSKPTPSVTTTVTPPLNTDSPVTSVTLPPKPSDPTPTGWAPIYEIHGTNVPYKLVAVIVVLACLLCVACFLVAYRRKRSNKTVMPVKDGKEEGGEMSSRESRSRDLPENMRNDTFDVEVEWRKSFTGVRAKSANAILFTSTFCSPVMDQATLQGEVTEKQENKAELDEETVSENQTKTIEEAEEERKLDDEVSSNAETVPYLSIGTNQNEKSLNESEKEPKDDSTERSLMEKVMSRISTWPLTAMQWQTRCKTTEEEEEEEEEGEKAPEVFTVMTPEIFKEDFNKTKQLLDASEAETEERSEKNPPEESSTTHSQSFKLNQNTVLVSDESLKEEEQKQQEKPGQSRERKAAEKSSKKSSRGSNKPAGRKVESKRAEREVRSNSTAPSAGASPDDETLLSGNEYAFMDLLHEVVQNNGRWTRERWRQRNRNRQRP